MVHIRSRIRIMSQHRVFSSSFRAHALEPSLALCLILCVAGVVPVCAQPGISDGQLTVTSDGRMGELREMPCAASEPGLSYERYDYAEYNAVEWQVRLESRAHGNSPGDAKVVHDNVQSAQFTVAFPAGGPVALHWTEGSHAAITDYRPNIEALTPEKPFVLESFGGRSSDGVMPYFNLASGNVGLIVAVGWSGDWRAEFCKAADRRVRVVAGLKRSHFRMSAGECLRLPSVLLMTYSGDWIDGQNQFRRLMLRHFTPGSHSAMELMPVAASVHGLLGFNATTEANLTDLANDIGALGLPLDTFWLDAGWNTGGFPRGQGNPVAAPARYPHGLRPVGEAATAAGMRFLAWFEPERAMRGTWVEREHPEWLLAPSNAPVALQYMENDGFRLLDMGNVEARNWAMDTVSRSIREAQIAIYRQDFNLYPAFFWHTEQQPDVVGLREIRYVSGLYDYLDGLARRHPGLILDNCASGGRRLDFEMMRRCVVLWRSDSCWGDKTYPRNVQAMTHGLSLWLPQHGLGATGWDDLSLRSGMGACACFAINFRYPAATAALHAHLERYLPVRPLFAADYYPPTSWSDDPGKWLAFQFHDPAKGEGLVQAFYGDTEMRDRCVLRLRGLEPNTHYQVTNWDSNDAPQRSRGSVLMERGVDVRDHGGHGAVVLHYLEIP